MTYYIYSVNNLHYFIRSHSNYNSSKWSHTFINTPIMCWICNSVYTIIHVKHLTCLLLQSCEVCYPPVCLLRMDAFLYRIIRSYHFWRQHISPTKTYPQKTLIILWCAPLLNTYIYITFRTVFPSLLLPNTYTATCPVPN